MGAFFVYIVKSSACLIVFYLFYRLLLSRETFHRFNRIGLLGLVLLSVVIPFFRITLPEPIVMQPAVIDLETLLMMATLTGKKAAVQLVPLWVQGLLWAYIGGVCFFCCQFIYSCGNTIRMIRRGKVSRLENGIRLVITPEAVNPFSWMRYILVSQKDMDEGGQEILTHEQAHIRLRHSTDLLISELCILIHWFNPAAWLLKQELQHIHEFEADENVLNRGVDAKKYQLLLIKKAVGSQRFTSMANSFNHSSLKKRITMMLKTKSNPWARLKYLCVLPLAAVAVVSFARPEIVRELDKISSVKFSELVPVKETQGVKNVEKPVKPDSITLSQPLVLKLDGVVMDDSAFATLSDIQLDLSDIDLDFNFSLDSLDKLEMPVFDFADIDLSQMQIIPDIQLNMEALQALKLDTAAMRQLEEKMRAYELTVEQKQTLMEHAQQKIAKVNEEQLVLQQEQLAKVMKQQEKVQKQQVKAVEQQVKATEQQVKALEKAQAKQQKEPMNPQQLTRMLPSGVYYLLDGKEATEEQIQQLPAENIESIFILKDQSAVSKFGEKARKGAVVITTKKK